MIYTIDAQWYPDEFYAQARGYQLYNLRYEYLKACHLYDYHLPSTFTHILSEMGAIRFLSK
jgi:hypothetical protein